MGSHAMRMVADETCEETLIDTRKRASAPSSKARITVLTTNAK